MKKKIYNVRIWAPPEKRNIRCEVEEGEFAIHRFYRVTGIWAAEGEENIHLDPCRLVPMDQPDAFKQLEFEASMNRQ